MNKIINYLGSILLLLFFASLFILIPAFFNTNLSDGTMPITNFLTDPATPLAESVRDNFWSTCLHMLPYLLISEGLLLFAMWKFRESNGHKAATFHDNIKLETFWTIVPFISVFMIAYPTYSLLEKINIAPKSDLEIKATAQRFSFSYKYLDYDISIADEPLIVPANKNIVMNMTSVDVIHAWWVSAFAVKYDMVPGRTTQVWFNSKPGLYKGQCAELCGPSHANMMITVKVVPEEDFKNWINKKVEEKNSYLTSMK